MRLPLFLLVAGFTLTAVSVYALASAVGVATKDMAGPEARAALAASVTAIWLAVELNIGGMQNPMLRRQAPVRYFRMFGARKAALLWGLDTGMVATTYRVTTVSWVALSLACFGLLPWWGGVGYAAGFCIPLAFLAMKPSPPGGDDGATEFQCVVGTFAERRIAFVRLARLVTFVSVALFAWIAVGS